jgi:hypothetical protein
MVGFAGYILQTRMQCDASCEQPFMSSSFHPSDRSMLELALLFSLAVFRRVCSSDALGGLLDIYRQTYTYLLRAKA